MGDLSLLLGFTLPADLPADRSLRAGTAVGELDDLALPEEESPSGARFCFTILGTRTRSLNVCVDGGVLEARGLGPSADRSCEKGSAVSSSVDSMASFKFSEKAE